MKTLLPAALTPLLAPALALAQPQPPWHHPLYLDGGGHWSSRVPLEVRNASDRDVQGVAQAVVVGERPNDLPLAGSDVKALRVCDGQGRELLYEVIAQDGGLRREGSLQAGDRLFFAVECPAGETRTYFVYADNERAWPVARYLRSGLINGGAEAGRDSPDGWLEAATDPHHVVSWVSERPHSGERCLKTVVQRGAEATWVKWHQIGIPVIPGATYELTAWVRARDARGTVGWFLHVNGDKPLIINRVLDAGEGTYDWRRLQDRFQAPEDAVSATVGTVLYGTGTAWFDDASLVAIDTQPACQVRVAAKQALDLAEEPAPATWYDDRRGDGVHWVRRWPVRVFSLSSKPRSNVLVRADLRRVLGGLRRPPEEANLRLVRGGRAVPYWLDGDQLLFLADLPARSVSRHDLYASPSPGSRRDADRLAADALVAGAGNLVRNPSFEQGDGLPDHWTLSDQAVGREVLWRGTREGLDGGFCARLDVPAEADPAWQGWHQQIPVRPNTTYFYAGRIKTRNVQGEARLHAHLHTAEGELVSSGAFVSTSPSISGTTEWTRTSTFFRTPADAASITLHLTMDAHGTLWHDDIILTEAAAATVDASESPPTAGSNGDPQVWQVNPLVKVFPDEPPEPRPEQIVVRLARNEYEPVQLVLRSPRRLPRVRVEVRQPGGPGGALLPQVAVNLVGFVPVDYPSSYYSSTLPVWYRLVPSGAGRSDGWAGEWPDPLPPYRPFELEPNRAQPLWLTVHAPANASPGEYRSSVIVRAGGSRVEIPLRVRVWDFALPAQSHCKAIYDLRSGPGWNVFAAADPEDHLRKWYRFLAQRRVSPDVFRPAPKFEYRDGQVVMDATEWDRMASYCLDELGIGVFYTPWQFYAFGWGYPPKKYFGLEPFTDEYNAAFQSMYRQFMDHLKAKGWHDKVVFYISDEPDLRSEATAEQMQKLCRLAQQADPDVPIYSSTWRHKPEWDGYLTMWGVGPHGSFPVETMRERRAAGDRLLFTTDGHMCIDTPYLAIERLLPHLCYKYDVGGYEFWGVSWWTYDPWERGWHTYNRQSHEGKVYRWVRYPNGDGYLTYPGDRMGLDEPVSSIRLEQARDGVEDYEYLLLLRDLITKAPPGAQRQAAERLLREAQDLVSIPNEGGLRSTSLMPHPDRVLEIRERLGEAILALAKAGD
ncbi:MAG: glycoside hydrolase domain-containing protein [Armatimonadota bacterium]